MKQVSKRSIPYGGGVFLFFFLSLAAEGNYRESLPPSLLLEGAHLHENYEVRQEVSYLFEAPLVEVTEAKSLLYEQQLSPVSVHFEVRRTANAFYFLFLNRDSEEKEKPPLWRRGNYILKKNIATNTFSQIKIFHQDDEGSYLRLFPQEDRRTAMDLFLHGKKLYEGVILPYPLEKLLVEPFERIMILTRQHVRWDLLLARASLQEWQTIAKMADTIAMYLPIPEVKEGAQNRKGEFVTISTLGAQEEVGFNCSGFVKWIADGLYGGPQDLMPLPLLKHTYPTLRGESSSWSRLREEDRDAYFGLDWAWNIVRLLKEDRATKKEISPPERRSSLSGSGLTFSSRAERQSHMAHDGATNTVRRDDVTGVPFFPYIDKVGIPVRHLRAALHLLTLENPGYFYLGVLSAMHGEDPAMRQYHHVNALFPYFTEEGRFHVSIMDTGREISPSTLERLFPASFIHFIKIRGDATFAPPQLERIITDLLSGSVPLAN